MLEYERRECNSRTMRDASSHASRTLSDQGLNLTYKFVQVDGSSVPESDDESTEFEHLLAEPRIEKDFVDGFLNFESENVVKCLSSEGFSCPLDYRQLKDGSEAPTASTIQGGMGDSKSDFLDGMVQGVDDVRLHNAIEDYLLDAEFSEKVVDYVSCEGPRLGNQSLDTCCQTLNKRDPGAVDMSKSVTPTVSVPEYASYPNAVDKMTIHELQETFRVAFGRDTSIKDKPWLKRRLLFGLENLGGLESVCPLESDISSNKNEGNIIFDGSEDFPGRVHRDSTNRFPDKAKKVGQGGEKSRFVGGDVPTASSVRSCNENGPLNSGSEEAITAAHKRLRKPTRRYIEETLELKSRSCSGRLESPLMNPRGKLKRARSNSQHRRNEFRAPPLVNRQDAPGRSTIQVPFAHHVWKGRPRKDASFNYSDYVSEDGKDTLCPSPHDSGADISDDNMNRTRFGKGGSRRKHHKRWSLSEVLKLVDGVSQYGVGRWTEIKRLLFQTTAHRTSVDLKDKWRNLLRASGAQLHGKKREVEQGRKHGTHSIPPSVLLRVKELAISYPYPRKVKSKLVRPAPVSISTSATCSDSSESRSERAVPRKRLT